MIYRALFRTVFHGMDPERAHHLGFGAVRAAAAVPGAGAALRGALAALGFAFVEIGTVTARAQPGNPAPRMFRLLRDRCLINRMGFNNDGANVVAGRLARRKARLDRRHGRDPVILGVNIGKTKAVPEGEAVADYVFSATQLAPFADYLTVNVSSPNTPGLRNLQAVEVLRPLLLAVRHAADTAAGRRVPLLVKIAPDLADEDVDAVADLAVEIGLDGIIATNTTIARDGLRTPESEVEACGAGGLSGPVLLPRALAVMGRLRTRVGPGMTLVGVGGITGPEDARAFLDAGATLLQGYTGFIYEGPFWAARIHRGLARTAKKGTRSRDRDL
jgi:dihydroorotate dehydrogenase